MPALPPAVEKVKGQALGLLADFWKDTPCEFPAFELKLAGRSWKIPNLLKPMPALPANEPSGPMVAVAATGSQGSRATALRQKWHALPGELAEKDAGEYQILPAGDAILDILIKPLGLGTDKFVLDLTAGLGADLRKLIPMSNQLKGFEADPAIAARGRDISNALGKGKLAPIEAYDPTQFSMPAIYHCMIARELFYRIQDKGKFFYSINAGIKEHGHIAFTDYIVDPENSNKPGIIAWRAHEKGAQPLGLIQMAEAWAKEGVKIKASVDQTELYRREIVIGINRFVGALKIAPPPDQETKLAIMQEVEMWIHRLAAIQQGMKFYCFHAVKG